MDRQSIKNSRQSILKPAKPDDDDEDEDRPIRKVRFSSNFVKPFATHDMDNHTIWDTTYEEQIEKSSQLSGKSSVIGSDVSEMEITLPTSKATTLCVNEESKMIQQQHMKSQLFVTNAVDMSKSHSFDRSVDSSKNIQRKNRKTMIFGHTSEDAAIDETATVGSEVLVNIQTSSIESRKTMLFNEVSKEADMEITTSVFKEPFTPEVRSCMDITNSKRKTKVFSVCSEEAAMDETTIVGKTVLTTVQPKANKLRKTIFFNESNNADMDLTISPFKLAQTTGLGKYGGIADSRRKTEVFSVFSEDAAMDETDVVANNNLTTILPVANKSRKTIIFNETGNNSNMDITVPTTNLMNKGAEEILSSTRESHIHPTSVQMDDTNLVDTNLLLTVPASNQSRKTIVFTENSEDAGMDITIPVTMSKGVDSVEDLNALSGISGTNQARKTIFFSKSSNDADMDITTPPFKPTMNLVNKEAKDIPSSTRESYIHPKSVAMDDTNLVDTNTLTTVPTSNQSCKTIIFNENSNDANMDITMSKSSNSEADLKKNTELSSGDVKDVESDVIKHVLPHGFTRKTIYFNKSSIDSDMDVTIPTFKPHLGTDTEALSQFRKESEVFSIYSEEAAMNETATPRTTTIQSATNIHFEDVHATMSSNALNNIKTNPVFQNKFSPADDKSEMPILQNTMTKAQVFFPNSDYAEMEETSVVAHNILANLSESSNSLANKPEKTSTNDMDIISIAVKETNSESDKKKPVFRYNVTDSENLVVIESNELTTAISKEENQYIVTDTEKLQPQSEHTEMTNKVTEIFADNCEDAVMKVTGSFSEELVNPRIKELEVFESSIRKTQVFSPNSENAELEETGIIANNILTTVTQKSELHLNEIFKDINNSMCILNSKEIPIAMDVDLENKSNQEYPILICNKEEETGGVINNSSPIMQTTNLTFNRHNSNVTVPSSQDSIIASVKEVEVIEGTNNITKNPSPNHLEVSPKTAHSETSNKRDHDLLSMVCKEISKPSFDSTNIQRAKTQIFDFNLEEAAMEETRVVSNSMFVSNQPSENLPRNTAVTNTNNSSRKPQFFSSSDNCDAIEETGLFLNNLSQNIQLHPSTSRQTILFKTINNDVAETVPICKPAGKEYKTNRKTLVFTSNTSGAVMDETGIISNNIICSKEKTQVFSPNTNSAAMEETCLFGINMLTNVQSKPTQKSILFNVTNLKGETQVFSSNTNDAAMEETNSISNNILESINRKNPSSSQKTILFDATTNRDMEETQVGSNKIYQQTDLLLDCDVKSKEETRVFSPITNEPSLISTNMLENNQSNIHPSSKTIVFSATATNRDLEETGLISNKIYEQSIPLWKNMLKGETQDFSPNTNDATFLADNISPMPRLDKTQKTIFFNATGINNDMDETGLVVDKAKNLYTAMEDTACVASSMLINDVPQSNQNQKTIDINTTATINNMNIISPKSVKSQKLSAVNLDPIIKINRNTQGFSPNNDAATEEIGFIANTILTNNASYDCHIPLDSIIDKDDGFIPNELLTTIRSNFAPDSTPFPIFEDSCAIDNKTYDRFIIPDMNSPVRELNTDLKSIDYFENNVINLPEMNHQTSNIAWKSIIFNASSKNKEMANATIPMNEDFGDLTEINSEFQGVKMISDKSNAAISTSTKAVIDLSDSKITEQRECNSPVSLAVEKTSKFKDNEQDLGDCIEDALSDAQNFSIYNDPSITSTAKNAVESCEDVFQTVTNPKTNVLEKIAANDHVAESNEQIRQNSILSRKTIVFSKIANNANINEAKSIFETNNQTLFLQTLGNANTEFLDNEAKPMVNRPCQDLKFNIRTAKILNHKDKYSTEIKNPLETNINVQSNKLDIEKVEVESKTSEKTPELCQNSKYNKVQANVGSEIITERNIPALDMEAHTELPNQITDEEYTYKTKENNDFETMGRTLSIQESISNNSKENTTSNQVISDAGLLINSSLPHRNDAIIGLSGIVDLTLGTVPEPYKGSSQEKLGTTLNVSVGNTQGVTSPLQKPPSLLNINDTIAVYDLFDSENLCKSNSASNDIPKVKTKSRRRTITFSTVEEDNNVDVLKNSFKEQSRNAMPLVSLSENPIGNISNVNSLTKLQTIENKNVQESNILTGSQCISKYQDCLDISPKTTIEANSPENKQNSNQINNVPRSASKIPLRERHFMENVKETAQNVITSTKELVVNLETLTSENIPKQELLNEGKTTPVQVRKRNIIATPSTVEKHRHKRVDKKSTPLISQERVSTQKSKVSKHGGGKEIEKPLNIEKAPDNNLKRNLVTTPYSEEKLLCKRVDNKCTPLISKQEKSIHLSKHSHNKQLLQQFDNEDIKGDNTRSKIEHVNAIWDEVNTDSNPEEQMDIGKTPDCKNIKIIITPRSTEHLNVLTMSSSHEGISLSNKYSGPKRVLLQSLMSTEFEPVALELPTSPVRCKSKNMPLQSNVHQEIIYDLSSDDNEGLDVSNIPLWSTPPDDIRMRKQIQRNLENKQAKNEVLDMDAIEELLFEDVTVIDINQLTVTPLNLNELASSGEMFAQREKEEREFEKDVLCFFETTEVIKQSLIEEINQLDEKTALEELHPFKSSKNSLIDKILDKAKTHVEYIIKDISDNTLNIFVKLGEFEVTAQFQKHTGCVVSLEMEDSYVKEEATAYANYINKFMHQKMEASSIESHIGKTFSIMSLLDYLEYQISEFGAVLMSVFHSNVLYNTILDKNQRLLFKYLTPRLNVDVTIDLSDINMTTVKMEPVIHSGPARLQVISDIFLRISRDCKFPLNFVSELHRYFKSLDSR